MELIRAEPSWDMISRNGLRPNTKRATLRVVVDARQVYRPQRRGIGKTLINLYVTLAELRPEWNFLLLHQVETSVPQLAEFKNLTRTRVDFYGMNRFDFWEQVVLPMSAVAARASILHAPANTGPRRSAVPVVVNIHDLIPLEMAPNAPETKVWLSRVKSIAARSKHILTGSEYSKQKLVEVLGTSPEKITVNAWAPDKSIVRVVDASVIQSVKARYGLAASESYLFAFGASDTRKNTAGVIQAYAGLPDRLKKEFKLVIVGVQENAMSVYLTLAEELGVSSHVVIKGFTPEEELSPMLSGASVLIFASKYEGFGLPILDAFLCGTPILAGNRTSLPEVGGDAAHYVDPYSIDSIRDGLNDLLTDESYRKLLSVRGLARSAEFTWERTANKVADVFEQIAWDLPPEAAPCE